MAVTKLSNSGIKTGIKKYDSMLAGNAAYDPAATWLIQRVTATGGETSLSFTNIPQTYTSLQIRGISRRNTVGSFYNALQFNSDTGANYVVHWLYGTGSSALATGYTSYNYIFANRSSSSTDAANIFGSVIFDIHDYNSTTRNKTVRFFGGYDANGAGQIFNGSGLWLNTNAITSVTVYFQGDALAAGSTFALYGFKGA